MDLPLDDPIHVSYEGQQEIGRRLAEIALGQVYKKRNRGSMILPQSIERVDTSDWEVPPCYGQPDVWRLKLSGVTGKLSATPFPTGFEVRPPEGTDKQFQFYRTQVDPKDGAAILLYIGAPQEIEAGLKLIYGPGLNPFGNIVDEKGMPIPAFGPVELPLEGSKGI
jgi:sialate O-acetylesterase